MALDKITTAIIADDAVTAAKIVAGAVGTSEIADGTVVAADIGDNSITLAKMAGGTDGQVITYDASGDPVAVGPGTAGQVLTSAGAGAPPTFSAAGVDGITSSADATAITIGADESVTLAGDLVPSTPLSHRNMIINGGMQVWQRATATTTVAFTYGTADRWGHYYSFNGSYTSGRYGMNDADRAATGQSYALKLACTGTDTSIGSGQYNLLKYRIEAQDCQHLLYGTAQAKTITISFWVKSSKIGTYCLTVEKSDSTVYRCPNSFTIDVADTWEKKVITITPTQGSTSLITATAGGIGNNNGIGLDIIFTLISGTDYQGTNATWTTSNHFAVSGQVNWADSTSNDFYLTGVQLELGSNATPFEHRSYAEELARCMRYYQSWGGNSGSERILVSFAVNTNQHRGELTLSPTMRATPTLSVSAAAHFSIERYGTNAVLTGLGFDQASPKVASFTLDCSGGFDAGEAAHLVCSGTTSARLKITAEL